MLAIQNIGKFPCVSREMQGLYIGLPSILNLYVRS